MKHCVIFPLRDKEDKVVSFCGRSIYNNTDQRHYYTSERKGLFPRWPHASAQTLILTEAVIDAATLYQLEGITSHLVSVVACYGTNGFTAEHEQAIKQWATSRESAGSSASPREVIIFFDGDEGLDRPVMLAGSIFFNSQKNLKNNWLLLYGANAGIIGYSVKVHSIDTLRPQSTSTSIFSFPDRCVV